MGWEFTAPDEFLRVHVVMRSVEGRGADCSGQALNCLKVPFFNFDEA